AASFAVGYLGISLWVVPDVAARGADLAHVPVVTLVGSARHYWGAVAAVLAAVCALLAAVFLMSSAAIRGSAGEDMARYAAPRARRSIARRQHSNAAGRAAPQDDGPDMGPRMSERMIWEALDEGRDPTDREQESDTEGR
ncbi:TIGR02234 family membrane protein, partial [Mycobacterium tuberculosis]